MQPPEFGVPRAQALVLVSIYYNSARTSLSSMTLNQPKEPNVGFWDCLPDSEMWEKCWNTTQQRTQLYTSPGPNPRDTQGHESLNWFGSLNSKSWLARTKKEAEVPLGRNSKCVAHITSLADCRNYVNHPPCTDRELLAAAHESRTAVWGRKKNSIWL